MHNNISTKISSLTKSGFTSEQLSVVLSAAHWLHSQEYILPFEMVIPWFWPKVSLQQIIEEYVGREITETEFEIIKLISPMYNWDSGFYPEINLEMCKLVYPPRLMPL